MSKVLASLVIDRVSNPGGGGNTPGLTPFPPITGTQPPDTRGTITVTTSLLNNGDFLSQLGNNLSSRPSFIYSLSNALNLENINVPTDYTETSRTTSNVTISGIVIERINSITFSTNTGATVTMSFDNPS